MKCMSLISGLGLGLAAFGAAADTFTSRLEGDDFSFAQWVDAISEDPQRAMSPQQAVVAFNETLERRANQLDETKKTRQSFSSCQVLGNNNEPAGSSEAAFCIHYLAVHGACPCELVATGTNYGARALCTWFSAQIIAERGATNAPMTVNCYDIAKTASVVMDNCWRVDHTVAGTAYLPQGGIAIHLQRSQMIQGPVPFNVSDDCYLKHASLFW
ncbi:hypothetical protein IQ07DRAFT_642018 [Pyrenochaeta sp. DS3sAY3a]|nr:hypothetical protein IQ07DRAFT_642018 [Pyrenochaeta sp. DS3sAY3a]